MRPLARDRLEERFHLRDEHAFRPVVAQGRDQRRGLHERVVCDPRHRRVAAASADTQAERGAHLLCDRADVERLAAELHPVARALVDHVVTADRVGMRLAQPLRAEARSDLLVGGRGEDAVARGLEPLPRQ